MKILLAMVIALLLFSAGVLLAPRLQPWLAHLNIALPPDPALRGRNKR